MARTGNPTAKTFAHRRAQLGLSYRAIELRLVGELPVAYIPSSEKLRRLEESMVPEDQLSTGTWPIVFAAVARVLDMSLRDLCPAAESVLKDLRLSARFACNAGLLPLSADAVAAVTHALRHTFASDCYDETGDVLAVRDLLGHASLGNTQLYLRGLSIERLRTAVEGRHYGDV